MSISPETSTHDEDAKIRATVADYIEGWWNADATRMERALHPDLVKRAYLPGSNGKPQILHLTAMSLVQFTRQSKDNDRLAEVRILDRFEGIASVRATMAKWVDYMHLVKLDGAWKIINILWEVTPEQWIARGGVADQRTR